MQPRIDPDQAVRREFDMLAARNTVEGYELFIARHPDHPLAGEARQRIEALSGRGRTGRPGTGGVMPPPQDPEKAISAEYEMLSARGTVEAYELFIARHPDHRLAREARRKIEALRGN